MNTYTIAVTLLCAAAIYFFVFSFSKTLRFMLRFVIRSALGIGGIALFNSLAASYSIAIGLNIYTCSLCGLLGLPGYILLLGTRLIF